MGSQRIGNACRTYRAKPERSRPTSRNIRHLPRTDLQGEEPKQAESLAAALRAIKEIEGIAQEEYQAIRYEIQCDKYGLPRVCTEGLLLIDQPTSEPEPTPLDKDVCEQVTFDLEVLLPALT